MSFGVKWPARMNEFNWSAIPTQELLYTVPATVEPNTKVFNVLNPKAFLRRVSWLHLSHSQINQIYKIFSSLHSNTFNIVRPHSSFSQGWSVVGHRASSVGNLLLNKEHLNWITHLIILCFGVKRISFYTETNNDCPTLSKLGTRYDSKTYS